MEDLTEQVEIVFYPGHGDIDPLDSSVTQLEHIDEPLQSPSRSLFCGEFASDHVFKIPAVPRSRKTTSFASYPRMMTGTEKVNEEVDGELEKEDEDEADADGDDVWEETLIYVDLDDIPSVEELFAVEPDDFLLSQSKRDREATKFKIPKQTRPSLTLKFFNLDGKNPTLQIGNRFYMGKYEEPMGSDLFFREKPDGSKDSTFESVPVVDPNEPPKTTLHSILTDINPPPHPVFGGHNKCTIEYELIANVHKVLKMTRRNLLRAEEFGSGIDSSEPQQSTSLVTNSDDLTRKPDVYKVEPTIDVVVNHDITTMRTVNLEDCGATTWRMRQQNKAFFKVLDPNEEFNDEEDDDDDENKTNSKLTDMEDIQ